MCRRGGVLLETEPFPKPLVPLGVAAEQTLPEPAAPLDSRPKKKAKKQDSSTTLVDAEHRGAGAQLEVSSKYDFPPGVVQVLNTKTKLVHLWGSARASIACAAWECGSPDTPGERAEFATSASRWDSRRHPYRFCINCHSIAAVKRLGGRVLVAGAPVEDSDSGSEGSSSASPSSS